MPMTGCAAARPTRNAGRSGRIGKGRTLAGAVLVAVAALAAVLVAAAPAQAHTALKESSPAKDATVPPPSQIVLTFTDEVMVPQVVVTDASGARRQSGPAEVDGAEVTQRIGGTLEAGTYTVGWRVVAKDGHPVTGTYTFTVAGVPQTPEASGTPDQTAPTTPAPQVSATPAGAGNGEGPSGWLWVGLAALVVAVVAAGVGLLRRRAGGR